MKTLNRQKGITLVALVVTIVILLILAGISINLVLGENGIVKRSEEARSKTELAQIKEAADLIYASLETDAYIAGISNDNLLAEIIEKLDDDFDIEEVSNAGATTRFKSLILKDSSNNTITAADVVVRTGETKTIQAIVEKENVTGSVRYYTNIQGQDYEITLGNNGVELVESEAPGDGPVAPAFEVTTEITSSALDDANATGNVVTVAKTDITNGASIEIVGVADGEATVVIKVDGAVKETLELTTTIPPAPGASFPGTPQLGAYYGEVTNYNAQGLVWRLFYDDGEIVYLIAETQDGGCLGDTVRLTKDNADMKDSTTNTIKAKYNDGSKVSEEVQNISPVLKAYNKGRQFTSSNTNSSIKGVAWLSDTEYWGTTKGYKIEPALCAIGAPTLELFQASWNEARNYDAEESKRPAMNLGAEKSGLNDGGLNLTAKAVKSSLNNGMYNNGDYWFASPSSYGPTGVRYFSSNYMYINNSAVTQRLLRSPCSLYSTKFSNMFNK